MIGEGNNFCFIYLFDDVAPSTSFILHIQWSVKFHTLYTRKSPYSKRTRESWRSELSRVASASPPLMAAMKLTWMAHRPSSSAQSRPLHPVSTSSNFYLSSILGTPLKRRRALPCSHLIVKPKEMELFSVRAMKDGVSSGLKEREQEVLLEPSDLHESQRTGENDKEDGFDTSDQQMIRVCDKLIEVFLVDKPKPTDWRSLLVFSKEWSNIRPHFYQRCQDQADCEDDPGKKQQLLRLGRKLKEIDEDVERNNELFKVIKNLPDESEIVEIVRRRRKDFTKEFFMHLHIVAESYYDNPEEQNGVVKLGNLCLSLVQAYDQASDSMEALNSAEMKFQDIIKSPSLDAACRKIDSLAEKNQLDSALVLMITKAYSAAKETNMTKSEVKDVMFHLYKTAVGNLQRQMPKEMRIIKYLLRIEDPEERLAALNDAFTPGLEVEGNDVDSLYTTPEKLYTWMGTVVNAYHHSQDGTLIRQARDMLNPKIIQKLEELMKLVQDKFM